MVVCRMIFYYFISKKAPPEVLLMPASWFLARAAAQLGDTWSFFSLMSGHC
jgi:hypothetical protein